MILSAKKVPRISANPFYAKLIRPLFVGAHSETKCALQFSFQSYLFLPFGAPLGQTLAQIAQDDTLHQHLLGQLLVMLGDVPTFKTSSGAFLSASQINYAQSASSIVALAIEEKEEMLIAYKTTLAKTQNSALKQFLLAILQDEEKHLTILKNFRHKN